MHGLKNRKNVEQNKKTLKNVKNVFLHLCSKCDVVSLENGRLARTYNSTI